MTLPATDSVLAPTLSKATAYLFPAGSDHPRATFTREEIFEAIASIDPAIMAAFWSLAFMQGKAAGAKEAYENSQVTGFKLGLQDGERVGQEKEQKLLELPGHGPQCLKPALPPPATAKMGTQAKLTYPHPLPCQLASTATETLDLIPMLCVKPTAVGTTSLMTSPLLKLFSWADDAPAIPVHTGSFLPQCLHVPCGLIVLCTSNPKPFGMVQH